MRPAAPAPDYGELGKTLAAELRAIMVPAAPAAPPVVADPAAGLSAQDRRNYDAFVELAATDPVYKGHPQKFLGYVTALRDYRARWAQENPGKKFDLAEHEDFVDQNQPSYDEGDFQAAITAAATRKVEERLRKEYDDKLAAMREEVKAPQVDAEAQRRVGEVQAKFLSHLPESDVTKLLAKDTGVAELREQDPVAFEVLNTVVGELQERVGELHKIHNRQGYFNPQNPVHSAIAQFVQDQEQAIKALPAGKQVHQGRVFATYQEMAQIPPAQRSRYWTLSENDIADVMTRKFASVAAKNLVAERTRLAAFATKYGYTKVSPASAGTQTPPAVSAVSTTPAVVSTPPPAGGSGDLLAPTTAGGGVTQKTAGQALLSSLWS